MKKTFLTQAAVARLCNIAPQTLEKKLIELAIQPDATLVSGGKKPSSDLFESSRISTIRHLLGVANIIL